MNSLARWARGKRALVAGTSVAIVVSLAAGCTSSKSSSSAANATEHTPGAVSSSGSKPLTIGYETVAGTSQASISFQAGMECVTKKQGGTIKTLNSNQDVNQQVSDLDQFIAQRVDAIVSLSLNPSAVTGPYQQAAAAHIPVVEMFNPHSAQPGSVYIRADSYGTDVLKHLKQRFPNGATAIVINGPSVPTVQALIGGFTSNAAAAGVKVVDTVTNTDPTVSAGQQAAADALTRYPNVNAVVAWSDTAAIGAGLAAKARGLDVSKMEIDGSNGTPVGLQAVKSGTITADYSEDLFNLGEHAAHQAYVLAAGQKVQPFGLPYIRYDKSNVDSYVPDSKRCTS